MGTGLGQKVPLQPGARPCIDEPVLLARHGKALPVAPNFTAGRLALSGVGPSRFSSTRLALTFLHQPFRLTRLIMAWASFTYLNRPS